MGCGESCDDANAERLLQAAAIADDDERKHAVEVLGAELGWW